MQVLGGPFGSYGQSIASAMDDFAIGNYERGYEKAVPMALVRNIMKAWRYGTEGVTSTRGVLVPKEDIKLKDVIGQGLGFAPADVAKAQSQSAAIQKVQQETNYKHNMIEKRILAAFDRGEIKEPKGVQDIVRTQVVKFNKENPEKAFTYQQLYTMILNHATDRAEARGLTKIDAKNARLFNEVVHMMRDELAERKAK